MADYPAQFSTPMVLALLDGRKSVTRRITGSPLARARAGDRLWVQEAHSVAAKRPASHRKGPGVVGRYDADGAAWSLCPWPARLALPSRTCRLSRFMPRELARLFLDISTINRLAPVQALTDEEAVAEGMMSLFEGGSLRWTWRPGAPLFGTPREAFAAYWDKLHTKPGERWADNPDVDAIYFRAQVTGGGAR